MSLYYQKDPDWKNKKLGYSNKTIGNYGCLITCLACLANIEPDIVNEILKDNKGYAQGNLLIWKAINHIPGLEFVWRGWNYNNDRVKGAIEKQGACIVEVDWDDSPKTSGSHFVLFTGDHKMWDVWNGKIETTNKYKILKGYAIVKVNLEDTMVEDTTIKIEKNKFEELVTKSTERDEWVEKMPFDNPEKVLIHMKDLRESIKGKNEEIRIAKERAEDWKKDYREIISVVAKALDTTQDRAEVIAEAKKVSDKLDKYADIRRKHDELNEEKAEMETELKSEVARLKALIKQENQLEAYDTVELIREVLKRIVKILPRS